MTLTCISSPTLFASSTPITILKSSLIERASIFQEIPIIYISLLLLLLFSLSLGVYCFSKLNQQASLPKPQIDDIALNLSTHNVEKALELCQKLPLFTARLLTCGIAVGKYPSEILEKALQAENRRISPNFWEKANLLNRFATLSCLIGILGSILCFFYYNKGLAFPLESLLPKLTPAIAGLCIGLFSKLFYTTLKYRESKIISYIQNLALKLAAAVPKEQT